VINICGTFHFCVLQPSDMSVFMSVPWLSRQAVLYVEAKDAGVNSSVANALPLFSSMR